MDDNTFQHFSIIFVFWDQIQKFINFVLFPWITGGQALGSVQEQTQDELREAEPRPALLLPQEYHPQDCRQTLRLPLCLWHAGHAGKDGGGGLEQSERLTHQHGVLAVFRELGSRVGADGSSVEEWVTRPLNWRVDTEFLWSWEKNKVKNNTHIHYTNS